MHQTTELISEKYQDDGKPTHRSFTKVEATIKEIDYILRTRQPSVRKPHEKCPLCGGNNAVIFAKKTSEGLPVNRQICSNCGLVYLAEYLLPEFAEEFYSKFYYRLLYRGVSAESLFENRISTKAFSWKRHQYVKEYLGKSYEDVKLVIEIGCNDGCNLYPYHLEGKTVIGCDFDEERINLGRQVGMTIHKGDVGVLLEKGYQADIVILSHVIDHLTHPLEILKKIKTILTSKGILYIENPGIYCEGNLLGLSRFEFTYWFELGTLQDLLDLGGFNLMLGDETIRSIFVQNKDVTNLENGNNNGRTNRNKRAKDTLKYLKQIETENLKTQSGMIGLLKKFYYYLKTISD